MQRTRCGRKKTKPKGSSFNRLVLGSGWVPRFYPDTHATNEAERKETPRGAWRPARGGGGAGARPLSRSFPQQWGPAGSFPAFSPGCLGDRGTVTTSAGFSRWIPSVPGPASLAEGRRLASADAACGPAPRPGSRQDRFPAARVEAGRCVASFSHAPRRERLPAAAGCCARLVLRKQRVSVLSLSCRL